MSVTGWLPGECVTARLEGQMGCLKVPMLKCPSGRWSAPSWTDALGKEEMLPVHQFSTAPRWSWANDVASCSASCRQPTFLPVA